MKNNENEGWKPYPDNRKAKYSENQITIIPDDNSTHSDVMPLFCRICHLTFQSFRDEKSYELFKCCEACADTWAYSHKLEWGNGWTPPKDQIEASIQKRIFARRDISFE